MKFLPFVDCRSGWFGTLCALLTGAFLPLSLAQPVELPAAHERVRVQQTVTNGFVHPGIGLTAELLERARAQVIARREPWLSYYRQLAGSPLAVRNVACRNESATHPGRPDIDAFDSRGVQSRLDLDGNRARAQALMYFFTGDEVYRANALRILRVWSQMDPAKFRYYPDAHIHSGWPLKHLLTAAEILRYTSVNNPALRWTDEDTRQLTERLINPMIATFLHSNGWFMNQNNFALHGAMAGFIFTDNRAGYDQRVEWFTVNRTAPNPGWDGSIRQLARLVDTDAITGKKVDVPQVQLVELGRDGAHAAEDVNLFVHISNLMIAQGTKVDPVNGVVSTAPDAVGPYEYLGDRILAVADYACRYMLGHDTRWIPVAYDIGPDGQTRRVYPRLSDQYRGRMTTFGFWQLYFHYRYTRGVDVARVAPYFYEAFEKRITDLDWLHLPLEAAQESARLLPAAPASNVVPLARRVTVLSPGVSPASEEGESFVRVAPAAAGGARFALLSAATPSRTVALRLRSNGPARMTMTGFAQPWIIPDTRGQWTWVPYAFGEFETLDNIAFLTVQAAPGTVVDFKEFARETAPVGAQLRFRRGGVEFRALAYVGAPLKLDFSAVASTPGNALAYRLEQAPAGAAIDARGVLSWQPTTVGEQSFHVVATDGNSTVARRVSFTIVPAFTVAVAQLQAADAAAAECVRTSRERLTAAFAAVDQLSPAADESVRAAALMTLQDALAERMPLTPTLADGSLDFVRTATLPECGKAIASLVDGNDDTFPVYTLMPDRRLTLDFGPGFRVGIEAFSLEGRLNFEERAAGSALFGSHDGVNWVRLTSSPSEHSTGLVRLEVDERHRAERFRYLRLQKLTDGLFEPCELRLHAQRYETD